MSAAPAAGAPKPLLRAWDGQRYRNALFVRRLTIKQIAQSAGVSRPHMTRIIHGERPPTPDILRVLQEAVGEAGWDYATGRSDRLPAEGI